MVLLKEILGCVKSSHIYEGLVNIILDLKTKTYISESSYQSGKHVSLVILRPFF